MSDIDKHIVWMHGEIKTPPFGPESRLKAGYLMRRLQKGEKLEMPDSRPMPSIGKQCHELRINDESITWRIVYFIDHDAIVILDVFAKKTQQTPKDVINQCQQRLSRYKLSIGD
jgi:phage-related protein